jgi:D-xylose transport system permease protein
MIHTEKASTTNPGTPAEEKDSFFKQIGQRDLSQFAILGALVLMAIYFNVTNDGLFLSARNISNLFLQVVTIGTVSLAAVLVLLLGEIDLSLAAVSSLSGTVMVVLSVRGGWNPWAAILAALVTGLIVGTINGVLIAVLRVPSFIVTLAGLIGYSGLLLHILLPQTTVRLDDPILTGISEKYMPDWLGIGLPILAVVLYAFYIINNHISRQRRGLAVPPLWDPALRIGGVAVAVIVLLTIFENYLGVPISPMIMFGLITLFWIILRFTTFGRHVYATGGNIEAARRAGINVINVKITVFALASMLAAAAGILEASRTISASAQVDSTLLLNAIAAAVIGGVSLFGGRGSAWSVVIGMLVIGGLLNGLTLQGRPGDVQQMIEATVLILAVVLDAILRRRNAVSGR